MENWLPIAETDGQYEVSDLGMVRNASNGFVLQPYIRGKYHCVSLRRNGERKVRAVHLTVLETFVGQRPDGKVAAHLDGKISNNGIANLAWVTPQENERHKIGHGTHRRGVRSSQARFTDVQVAILREAYALGLAMDKLAALTGVNGSTIYRIVKGARYAD